MIRKLATWVLRPFGVRTVRVLTGPSRGARMRLNLHRDKALWAGVFEQNVLRVLVAIAERSDRPVWDVGANVGYHSLALARTRPVLAV